MSLHTAFVEPDPALSPGSRIRLDDAETRHLRAVRADSGDRLLVTDGEGGLWLARLEEARSGGSVCVLLEARPAPGGIPVGVAFGVGERTRMLWLVEKAVELGASRLTPVELARSRSVADAARASWFSQKARRRAVAALKQCGGARLPRIDAVTDLAGYLERATSGAAAGPLLLARSGAGRTVASGLEGWDGRSEAFVLVGPEGGLEPGELEACEAAGFRSVDLGPRTLRFETAAVAALAAVAQAVLAGARRCRRSEDR